MGKGENAGYGRDKKKDAEKRYSKNRNRCVDLYFF